MNIKTSGLSCMRLPIRFKVQEDNAELSRFIFDLLGPDFYAYLLSSSAYVTEEDIQAGRAYYVELAKLNERESLFPDEFTPSYSVIERLPFGGEILRIDNSQSLNFFLSTGDTDSSLSFFSSTVSLNNLLSFLSDYRDSRLEKIDSGRGNLLIEEYISSNWKDCFSEGFSVIDTLYYDEDDVNYLVVSSDSSIDLRVILRSLKARKWLNKRVESTLVDLESVLSTEE